MRFSKYSSSIRAKRLLARGMTGRAGALPRTNRPAGTQAKVGGGDAQKALKPGSEVTIFVTSCRDREGRATAMAGAYFLTYCNRVNIFYALAPIGTGTVFAYEEARRRTIAAIFEKESI